MFWLTDKVSSGVLGGVLVAVEGIDIKLPGKYLLLQIHWFRDIDRKLRK